MRMMMIDCHFKWLFVCTRLLKSLKVIKYIHIKNLLHLCLNYVLESESFKKENIFLCPLHLFFILDSVKMRFFQGTTKLILRIGVSRYVSTPLIHNTFETNFLAL